MSTIIVCRDGPDSREGTTREPIIPSRPSVGGSTHLAIRRSVPLPHDLCFVVWSGVGCRRGVSFDRRNLELVKVQQPLKFTPIFQGVGSLIPIGFHRALTVCQDTTRVFADQFQNSILSTGSAGLVGCFDRHEATKEKFPHDGKTGTRPGNLTARKRNAY